MLAKVSSPPTILLSPWFLSPPRAVTRSDFTPLRIQNIVTTSVRSRGVNLANLTSESECSPSLHFSRIFLLEMSWDTAKRGSKENILGKVKTPTMKMFKIFHTE